MANRTYIQHGTLDLFKEFIVSKGFVLEEPKGKYEVLRARYVGKPNKKILYKSQKTPLIIFDRERGCGYTIQNQYQFSGIFAEFRALADKTIKTNERFKNYRIEKGIRDGNTNK